MLSTAIAIDRLLVNEDRHITYKNPQSLPDNLNNGPMGQIGHLSNYSVAFAMNIYVYYNDNDNEIIEVFLFQRNIL